MMLLKSRPHVATWQVTLAGALLVLGFMVAAQIRADAPSPQYSSQERPALVQTVRDLQTQHDALTKQIHDVRAQIDALRQGGQGHQSNLATLDQQLKNAQMAAGFVQIQGPGGYIRLADGDPPTGSDANPADFRITASDLRVIVNGLWRAGAEAIAIDQERVVTSTAILDVGGAILVNSAYVSGPYQISVIGPADFWTNLTGADTFKAWMETRYGPYRLSMGFKADPAVVILGYAGSANLHYARVSAAPSPSASASASVSPAASASPADPPVPGTAAP